VVWGWNMESSSPGGCGCLAVISRCFSTPQVLPVGPQFMCKGVSQKPARSQPGASQEPGASKGPVLILANALATDSKRRARRLIWVPASLVLSTE
jgi:hypothetical protein